MTQQQPAQDRTTTASVARSSGAGRFASQREALGVDADVKLRHLVGALLVDQLPGFAVLVTLGVLMLNDTISAPIAILGAIAAMTISSLLLLVVLRGSTGQSYGDRRIGLEYVDSTTGAPVGLRRILVANSDKAAASGIRVRAAH